MDPVTSTRSIVATCASFAAALLLAVSGAALADPPSRVARLAYAEGGVSFSPAGDGESHRYGGEGAEAQAARRLQRIPRHS